MTITVDISPEVQAELERQAASRGVEVPVYVATLIEKAAQSSALCPRPQERKSLAQLFAESPLAGMDLDFSRNRK